MKWRNIFFEDAEDGEISGSDEEGVVEESSKANAPSIFPEREKRPVKTRPEKPLCRYYQWVTVSLNPSLLLWRFWRLTAVSRV